MPAHSVKPAPCVRMRALLEQAVLTGYVGECPLLHGGARTRAGFEDAWETAWRLMISERAYPHRTTERAQWREALASTRPEFRAAYIGAETAYSRAHTMFLVMLAGADFSRPVEDDGAVMAELVA